MEIGNVPPDPSFRSTPAFRRISITSITILVVNICLHLLGAEDYDILYILFVPIFPPLIAKWSALCACRLNLMFAPRSINSWILSLEAPHNKPFIIIVCSLASSCTTLLTSNPASTIIFTASESKVVIIYISGILSNLMYTNAYFGRFNGEH